jgi:protein-L-isoaspartate(D-aspartate) O-methyltransferase
MEHARVVREDSRWRECVERLVQDVGVFDEEVELLIQDSFSAVPRGNFVDETLQEKSYDDRDIELEHGQWLTRPSVLVRMMDLIALRRRMRVLELGVGSGYLCAVMSVAGAHVFGVEVLSQYAQSARKHLDMLGHHGVVVRRGEGKKGWAEVGPFEAIVASYLVENEEELPLLQLADGGILVAPLMLETGSQEGSNARLTAWKRRGNSFQRTSFETLRFR